MGGDVAKKLPSLPAGTVCEHMKVELFEPVAHARLVLQPTEKRWNVDLQQRPEAFLQRKEESDKSAVQRQENNPASVPSLEFEARVAGSTAAAVPLLRLGSVCSGGSNH